jgi:hypothetical protein
MAIEADVVVAPVTPLPHPISLFHRIWPVALLAVGLTAAVAWAAILG